MQIVCKLTLTMREKSCLNAIFADGWPGAECHVLPGVLPRHVPNLEHAQGVEYLGALVAPKTSWAPAYTLKALLLQHPALPRGSRVVLPHQHHSGSSSGKKPPSPRPQENPQQPLSGKNSVCGRCRKQRWPRSQSRGWRAAWVGSAG